MIEFCLAPRFSLPESVQLRHITKMTHIESGEGAAIICLIIFQVRQVIEQYCASQQKKKFLACLSFSLKDCCTYFSKTGIYLEIRTLLQRTTKISRSSTRFYFEARQNSRKYKQCSVSVLMPFQGSGLWITSSRKIILMVVLCSLSPTRQSKGVYCLFSHSQMSVRCLCSLFVSQIYLRFLDYEMQNSNECKRNFVAVYDGSSSVEDLKAKFCSTVANDVMLRTGLGVIRMWADEGSRSSRFQMLFTSFQERKTLINVSAFQFVK